MNEITNNNITDEDISEPVSTMKKRWLLTINNPVFADSGYTETDITNTELEVLDNHYDLSVLYEDENKDYFDFRYIQIDRDGKSQIIKRPFFKDLDSIEKYFKTLREFGNLKYAIYQYERGENGTPHIQAFIIYKNSKRFKNVKQDFPTAHIIVPNGSNIENRDYCTKKDTRIAEPVEIGEFSEMRSRNDIVQFLEMVKLGASNVLLKNMFPVLYTQYGSDKIEKFRQDELREEYGQKFRDITTTYIYGTTGKGKTRYVMEKYGYKNVYRVTNYLHPFDMYHNQKVIIFEEFRSSLKIEQMLNYLDGYPLALPARYGDKTACFDTVYLISNIPLSGQYAIIQTEQPMTYDAFLRRIKYVWEYDKHPQPIPRIQSTQTELIPVTDDELPF